MDNDQLPSILRRLDALEERNRRVEAGKAWETSPVRISIISIMIAAFGAIFLTMIDVPHPLLNALLPPLAYFVSTQSLPMIKKRWMALRKKKSP